MDGLGIRKVPPLSSAARADDTAVTAHLQQVLDAYVKDRGPIEGLSGAALQVDRGAGKAILAGEDKFSPAVIGDAFMALQQAELPDGAPKPATK